MGLLPRIGVVVLAVTAIWILLLYGNWLSSGREYSRAGHVVSAVLATALATPVVVLSRRYLDRRPLATLGLPSARSGFRSFLVGAGCYLLPASLALGAALASGWVTIALETSRFSLVTTLLGLPALVFFYEALPEELVFRGYVYRNLSAAVPRWAAVLGQAVLFGLWGASTWVVTAGVSEATGRLVLFVVIAAVLGAIRVVTGDVWACVGFHLAFQTVQQLFGGGWAAGTFAVGGPGSLETVVLGLIPLALAVPVLQTVVREETSWHVREPDPAPAGESRAR